jgi:hypothetical protein
MPDERCAESKPLPTDENDDRVDERMLPGTGFLSMPTSTAKCEADMQRSEEL